MKPSRTILHLDLDAFFCCVEELRTPSLRGRAFAVGGSAEGRGVVSSCSYPARTLGVRSAMPMAQAARLAPGLIVIAPHFDDYRHYSRRVMDLLHTITPIVEPISIDEAFLDITGLPGEPATVARMIQARIRAEFGLPCSLGSAASKLVAKIATNRGKATQMNGHTPQAIEVVSPGTERLYLAPLLVGELYGVGPRTAEQLRALGIHTIGDLAAADVAMLQQQFGRHGHDLWHRANARDNRRVATEHETKSISSETTFSRDVTDLQRLEAALEALAAEVGRRLRSKNLQGTTVKLKLRWHDFTTVTRQTSLATQTSNQAVILEHTLHLLEQAWQAPAPVRLIGVGVTNLRPAEQQLSLFDSSPTAESHRVARLVDELQARYGRNAFQRARDLPRRR